MKRSKRLYILLGVLVAIGAATFAVNRYETYQEKISSSDSIVLELSADSVESLSWEYEDTSLSFHNEDGWLYDGDEAFPVDEEKIAELLGQFEAFAVSFIIEDVEDYGQYGLDDPTCTINITTAEQSYEILLGDYSSMDLQRYVSTGDGNVYLAASDPLEYFDATLDDMIKHDEAPVFDTVSEISFSGEETYSISYEEDSPDTYCADDVYFAEIDGENLPVDTNRVNSYLSTISYLDLSDYVSYNVTDEELETFGLDSPELEITVCYTAEDEDGTENEETFTLSVSRSAEEKAADESAGDEEQAQSEDEDEVNSDSGTEDLSAYVRVGQSQIIYRISSSDYQALMSTSYDDLRHRDLFTAEFDDITSIDIALEGQEHTITVDVDEDENTVYIYEDEEIGISGLRSAIEALSSDNFTDEQPGETLEIALTIGIDNENHPEVQIELYRYDGTYCLAVLNGETVSLMDRSLVVDLIEAVNAIVLN